VTSRVDPIVALPALEDRSRRGLISVSIGNALEWFNWTTYVIFSGFFAVQFFPGSTAGTSQLQTLMIFALGSLVRPFGGVILGGFADRRGRRAGLTLSMLLMASGSLLIAVSPTYAQIGLLAPGLLLLARIAQSLSIGGEIAAAVSYLAEIAPPGRRGFYSSFAYVTGTLGPLAATMLAGFLIGTLGQAGVVDWGWRVPFAVGALLGVYGIYLRRSLDETGPYLAGRDRRLRRPTREFLRRHPISGLRVIGFTIGATVVYYAFLTYLPGYVQKTYGVSSGSALWASIIAQIVMVATLPLFGVLSDRIGRKPLLIAFALGFVLLIVPLFTLLNSSAWSLLGVMSAGLLLFSCYAAVAPIAMAELFPTQVRAVGVGLPYSLTVGLFGGTAPYLVEYLTEHGHAHWFSWYVAVLCLVSLVAYLTAPETMHSNLEQY
jgi:MFS transporter, MHS family, alpha-ketoglutarate permease